MWGPQEYVTYELVLASPAVSGVSGSSNLNSFRDGRQVAVQLASRGVLLPGLVQYCSQHSCVVAIKFLLQPFIYIYELHLKAVIEHMILIKELEERKIKYKELDFNKGQT